MCSNFLVQHFISIVLSIFFLTIIVTMSDVLTPSVAGNYRRQIQDVESISFKDFENPWNFYKVMVQSESDLKRWLIENDMLPSTMKCVKKIKIGERLNGDAIYDECPGEMTLKSRAKKPFGVTLRCDENRDHETSIMTNTFFEKSKLQVQDIFMFIKCYLERNTLQQCSRAAGISYRSTSVDWASFIREMMKEHYYRYIRCWEFTGDIEIDESLFGRCVKYHRGNPHKGLKVWVFGMVERASNRILLYPVNDRKKETLIPLIRKHVQVGSTIYSDGWSAYCDLNSLGYNHFSVIHKYAFKKEYKNVESGEIISVHTNRMEGAWKHAKDYFRRMSGTKATQWEGHMAEVMWRSEVKSNVYDAFFTFVKEVYTLQEPPRYYYTTPLFSSWSGINDLDLEPAMSDAVSTDTESEGGAVAYPTTDEEASAGPSEDKATADKADDSSGDDTLVFKPSEKLTSTPKVKDGKGRSRKNPAKGKQAAKKPTGRGEGKLGKDAKMRSDNVCHPKGYKETKKEGRPKRKNVSNPYSRSNFVWSSSDDDFQ